VQELAAATELQLLVCANCAALVPEIATPVTVSVAPPVLLTVKVSGAETTPAAVLGNVSVEGASDAVGTDTALPEPVNAMVCGEPEALSASVTVDGKLATDWGLNATEIVQDEFAATLAPHVLVMA
jgi:hypothetical protein